MRNAKSTIHSDVLTWLRTRPLAIDKSWLTAFLLDGHKTATVRADAMTPAQIDAAVQAADRVPNVQMIGAIAVIPIRGCITQKSDFYSWYFGGTSIERLTAAFRHCLNDPQVSTIVFDVDSPGGEVYGVQECFEEMFAARGQKKMFAICNPCMASAAYWLACAADQIWQIPSGQSGSIGCYVLHADVSKALEDFGVKMTFIQYGEHKTDGNPYEPLSDSAREELQARVNYYGIAFDRGVAAGRDVSEAEVRARFGQGRMFIAPAAKKAGLINQVGTLDKLLAKLAPGRSRIGMAAEAPESSEPAPAAPQATEPEPVAAKEQCVSCGRSSCPCQAATCGSDCETCDPACPCVKESRAEAQRQADADACAVTMALTE